MQENIALKNLLSKNAEITCQTILVLKIPNTIALKMFL
mgnify:CR=1 FL=1